MTRHVLILIAIFFCKNSDALYIRTFLPALVENSKVIALGKIISVDNETFKIVALKPIKSARLNDTITILKFTNWTCAARYADYIVGQEAIFFISKDKQNKYFIMGEGNEGELVVKSDTGYYENYDQKIYKTKKVDFISKYKQYIAIPVKTILKGIKIYMDNCEAINKETEQKHDGEVVYKYSTIDKLPKNEFLSVLIDQKRRRYWTVPVDGN